MAVFSIIKSESKVQVKDKVRFLARESFVTRDEADITAVEIKPDASSDFVDVTSNNPQEWYLDWVYLTEGEKTATLRVTSGTGVDAVAAEADLLVSVVTAEDDCLFSTDEDLRSHEHDISQWLPEGYSSWNHVHRAAQKNILDWFDEQRIFKADGTRWTPQGLLDIEEVRKLSTMIALRMIFGTLSNQSDDIFREKRDEYLKMEKEARNRNHFTLDYDSDGVKDDGEKLDLRTLSMVRR